MYRPFFNKSELIYMKNDTIAAVSTPYGSGAIALVRVSGDDAFKIVSKIFKSKNNIENASSHSLIFGKVVYEGNVIDKCLCGVFKAPDTFTGENMAEINCHGGIRVTAKVLEAVLSAGARMAEKGEFSKRAFINGRMDLSEAEAVIDLINAKTDKAVLMSAKQLEGGVSGKINQIRDSLTSINAKILAVIDFPDEEIEEFERESFKSTVKVSCEKIEKLVKSFNQGKIYRSGLSTLILGKTNAGKSSLLNRLLNENKAIVTDIAGTTRDVIEDFVEIKGIPVKLMDTAGIRKTDDVVENIGVKKSKELIDKSDLILYVMDSSRPFNEDDDEIKSLIKDKNVIFVKNKCDLERVIQTDEKCIEISCETGHGIDRLCDEIALRAGEFSPDETLINNVRHKYCLERASACLKDVLTGLEMGLPLDILSIDIEEACISLGYITGLDVSEKTVEHIFADFCVGK